MLQIQHISKKYVTGDLVQHALDDVSLNLRDNEFVAVLGPSGSGKTTLLNIIGGLDRYDGGDLIINGVSTQKYRDRDWDSYRNHTIGFVFQSYNLIPHQSVLSNVELALTISGISRAERRKRAIIALEQVGLGDQVHKKPNQMSGGQMQRVAIARALVNNPDVLLADEPTGALDTETSVQVMELLKEVAKNRLVVMVTHNPELAEEYATRIVRLRDGRITDDSHPYEIDTAAIAPPQHKNMGRSSMSFLTSLSLSFNNLRTKKGRTLLTSFAGSIGIIGIALILSISSGVNAYIGNIQKETMTSYPIAIEDVTMDLSGFLGGSAPGNTENSSMVDHALDGVYSNGRRIQAASALTSSYKQNDLASFKKYLDNPDSAIYHYVGENGIVYSYDTQFAVYAYDPDGVLVNTDGSTLTQSATGMVGGMTSMSEMMGYSASNVEELVPGNGNLISAVVTDNYDLIYGVWPEAYNELVLVLNRRNEISSDVLYELGILPSAEYKQMLDQINAGEEVTVESHSWRYEDICSKPFYLIPECDTYLKNENGFYTAAETDSAAFTALMEQAIELKIVGIIRPGEDNDNPSVTSPLAYTKALTDYLIKHADESAVVLAQQNSPAVNVLDGLRFAPADDSEKIEDTKRYFSSLGVSEKAKFALSLLQNFYAGNPEQLAQLAAMSENQLAAMLDPFLENAEDAALLALYERYVTTYASTLKSNLALFGVVNLASPSSINIYADSFEDKDAIANCIVDYNKTATEEQQITYTDYVALLMNSVTTIVNVISYVLIAFVAVSLVVSSIMIGIITYISVLERTKEIGILRAIGASKRNISRVFNAETLIIGLCAGLIGIGLSLLLLLPGNALIHSLAGSTDINAFLPLTGAVILVLLSMLLTLLGGLIPSRKAAKKDPVTALRTE